MRYAGVAVGGLRVRRVEDAFGHGILEGLAGSRRCFRIAGDWHRMSLVGGASPDHQGAIIAVVAIGIVAFCTIEGCIIGNMNAQGEPDLDYVIVLGAQVRESGPSKALRYRLDRTIDYLEENPDTICIVSGGQGHNEPFAEAQGMADYLQKHGIAENRIIQESKSESTMENIVNSKKLMRQENASVGIVTNDFHMFRALQIAHANGLKQAQGIAASSPKDMLVNNMVREFFAEIKFLFS